MDPDQRLRHAHGRRVRDLDTTIGLRLGFLPRWLGILGFVTAVALLVGSSTSGWLTLAFPGWVLVLSAHILLADIRRSHDGADGLGVRPPTG